jgi:predicted ATPase/class 3 adenylate cyclase
VLNHHKSMRPDLPTGTVTFLFTDIEGSTRLLHALGPEPYAEALAEHRRVLREAFAAHRGIEVDTQGDAFFVAFPTASGAAHAALAGRDGLDRGRIHVRMGLHTGEPTVTPEGYVGVDVHRGARVAALAHGRQVLLTEQTAALLEGDVEVTDLGRHRLKDFDGPVHVLQLGSDRFPALRSPGAVDLPSPATPFLGRDRELFDAVATWLEQTPRLLTVVGPGGTGKTRFAIELARLLAEDADGGTLWIPLAPLREPALVPAALGDRLGAASGTVEAIADRVGERQTHVVLDNLEQLLPGLAEPLSELVAAAPSLRLIATSREPVRISGETELDLPPLEDVDAISLFLARGRAVRPDLVETPAVDELVRRLDRLPLALELAAARTKLLSPEVLLERLGERFDLLRGSRDADPRHATLRATLAWSYDLLGPDEQALFGALAVFPGGCTLEAAEDVCETDLDTVASLLDKSLLRRRTDPDGVDRYWMLETIREFAAERLAETGSEPVLRERQVERLLALARRAGGGGLLEHRPLTWRFDLIEPELDNVRAALTWAGGHDPGLGLRLACSLEEFWVVRGPEDGTMWLQRLLAEAPDAPVAFRAHAWRALAGTLDIVGDHEGAAPHYRASLALYEELGDELQAANLRFRIAANLTNRGHSADALPLLFDALAEFGRLGFRAGEAEVIGYLGHAAARDSDFATAKAHFERSAAIVRDLGWSWWESNMLQNLAWAERSLGSLDEARIHARRSFVLAADLGDRMGTVFAAAELAAVAALRKDPALTGRLWGAIETEVDVAPVGQWPAHRETYEAIVLDTDGDAFAAAVEQGRLLTLAEAVGVAAAEPEP